MKDKKALLILIPFLLFVIIIGAFAIVGDRIPDNPPETVGNTAGNLNNSGYFCEYDGKVYFANVYDSDTFRTGHQKTGECLRTKYPGWR
jgi:hypothetical protein